MTPNATHSARDPAGVGRFENHPRTAAVAAEMLWHASRADDAIAYLGAVLPAVMAAAGGDYAALAAAEAGRWTVTAEAGPARSLPIELLGEAADREAVAVAGSWLAMPLSGALKGDSPVFADTKTGTSAKCCSSSSPPASSQPMQKGTVPFPLTRKSGQSP